MRNSNISELAVTVLFSSFSWAPQATAQQIDGNELLAACTSTEPVLQGFCIGYTIGAIEGESLGTFIALKQASPGLSTDDANEAISRILSHCIPADAPNAQLRDVVLKYLQENPADRHHPARGLIWNAMVDGFPCN